jgi:hypothetical protein
MEQALGATPSEPGYVDMLRAQQSYLREVSPTRSSRVMSSGRCRGTSASAKWAADGLVRGLFSFFRHINPALGNSLRV